MGASAEARLRIVVEAIANTAGLNGLFSQLNGLGKNMGSAMGGFTSASVVSSFNNLTSSVSSAHGKLTEIKTSAGDVKRVLEVDLTNATKSATSAVTAFHGEMQKIKDDEPQQTQALENIFAQFAAWISIQQAAIAIKNFGKALGAFLVDGMTDSADKEAATVRFIEGLLVNNPEMAQKLEAAGGEAIAVFRKGIADAVNKKAIEIGLNTTFTDNQVAQGMAILSQAGVDTQHILDGVAESMAYLAMIGRTDIQTSARGMVSIYNMFGDRLTEQFAHIQDEGERTQAMYTHVADVVANSMLSSGMTFQELLTALSYAGASSAMAGQSFADTAAVLALFAKNGIQGSKAGTGLRRIITNLTPTSEKAAEAIKAMTAAIGGSEDVFYDANGRMKSLAEVQQLLFEAMADKSPQEQIYLLKTIFGQWAIGQALILATSDEFGNLSDKIAQTGTATRQVNSIMESSKGITDRSTEATKTLAETMGTTLNQHINPFKVAYADLIENYISNTPPAVQGAVATLLGFVSVFAILVGTIGSAVAGFALFKLGLAVAGISLGAVALIAVKIIAIVAAIAAVAVLVYKAWTENWGGFRDFTKTVWDEVKAVFSAAVAEITAWWNDLAPTATKAWENVKIAFNAVVEWFNAYILPALQLVWDSLVLTFKALWETMKGVLQGAWEVLSGIFGMIIAAIAGDWDMFFEQLKRTLNGFVVVVQSVWNGFFNALFGVAETVLKAIVEAFGLNWESVKVGFDAFKTAFFAVFDAFFNSLRVVFDAFVKVLRGDWESVLDDIKKFIEDRRQAIADAFQSVVDGIASIASDLMSSAASWGRNLVQNMIDGISSKIGELRTKASEMAGVVKDFLGFSSPTKLGPGATADRWMPNLIGMLADQLTSSRPMLQRALDGVASDISLGVNGASIGGLPSPASRGAANVNIMINYGGGNRSEADYLAKAVRQQVAMVTSG